MRKEKQPTKNVNIVEELQSEMKKSGYISEPAILKIAKKLNKSESEVYGVATFYNQFKFQPTAKYLIEVCTGTTCFIQGSGEILEGLKQRFNVTEHENTPDNKFCIGTVRCIGCCGEAPVVRINGKVYGKMTLDKVNAILDELK